MALLALKQISGLEESTSLEDTLLALKEEIRQLKEKVQELEKKDKGGYKAEQV